VTEVRWIDLDGADNVRDVGDLPTVDGRTVRPGRLIRSDSLQELTPADVRHLVDDLNVRAVADLRTGTEVVGEGPGPLTDERLVEIRHLSLFVEDPDRRPAEPGEPVVLPWQERNAAMTEEDRRRGAAGIYERYLDDRADSVLEALRLIAHSDGATLVHCASGKDRTGVIVAFALAEVGVTREAIVADYERSADRVEANFRRLAARPTYASALGDESLEVHKPRAETMAQLLDAIDRAHGGMPAWLRANGWTDDDAAALRAKLLD
jgi:protein tyrosine/serine phosphatase